MLKILVGRPYGTEMVIIHFAPRAEPRGYIQLSLTGYVGFCFALFIRPVSVPLYPEPLRSFGEISNSGASERHAMSGMGWWLEKNIACLLPFSRSFTKI